MNLSQQSMRDTRAGVAGGGRRIDPTRRPIAAVWMGAAFCGALSLAAIILTVRGGTERGIDGALFATGRLAFLLFWPAYAAGAIAALFGPAFAPLKRRMREFGLAFAAVLVVHLGLIAWLCVIGAAPGMQTFVFFGIAAAFAFLLALFSIARLQRGLGPRVWWLLRAVGLNYIAYAFAVDFLNKPFEGGWRHVVLYAPFAVLAILGPGLRVAALAQRVARTVWRSSYRAG